MNELDSLRELVIDASLRARGHTLERRRRGDHGRPAAIWRADARIGRSIGTAISIVLRTRGCSHALGTFGGCTMCSYLLDGTSERVSSEDIVRQFESITAQLDGVGAPVSVKVYTSGSFLDPDEVPVDARDVILQYLSQDERVHEVVLESRPQYVTEEALTKLRAMLNGKRVEIGMGLESGNEMVRTVCINKGLSNDEFQRAVSVARQYGIGTRAYILVKPPFLTERDALIDSLRAAEAAVSMGATTISVNPVNIQRATLVEKMWQAGEYTPPWLWTVVELLILARTRIDTDVNIVCDPVAAGKVRGTHNCGLCDNNVTAAIRKFSLDQDIVPLTHLTCECKALWRHLLQWEDLCLSAPLVQRHTYTIHS